MQSDKNYLIYQVLDRARLVPCTREQAIERAEEGKKLIAKIDSLRQDYTGKYTKETNNGQPTNNNQP